MNIEKLKNYSIKIIIYFAFILIFISILGYFLNDGVVIQVGFKDECYFSLVRVGVEEYEICNSYALYLLNYFITRISFVVGAVLIISAALINRIGGDRK